MVFYTWRALSVLDLSCGMYEQAHMQGLFFVSHSLHFEVVRKAMLMKIRTFWQFGLHEHLFGLCGRSHTNETTFQNQKLPSPWLYGML